MSRPFVVSIPHSLGKDEAARRIKEGVQWAQSKYGAMANIAVGEWADNTLGYRVGVLGQNAQGTIAVTDADATVTIELPWLLAKFADKVQAVVEQQGQLLLQKK